VELAVHEFVPREVFAVRATPMLGAFASVTSAIPVR
jgi:hypothetical protein